MCSQRLSKVKRIDWDIVQCRRLHPEGCPGTAFMQKDSSWCALVVEWQAQLPSKKTALVMVFHE